MIIPALAAAAPVILFAIYVALVARCLVEESRDEELES